MYGSWNFGPNIKNEISVKRLTNLIFNQWIKINKKKMKLKIHNQKKLNYENKYLTINSLKSFKTLGWKQITSLSETCFNICEWYSTYFKSKDKILNLSLNQIDKIFKKKLNS